MHTITLTTTGRLSGRTRAVTLFAFDDGDRLVVVGSRGGSARHPGWVHNLRAEPTATLTVGTELRRVRAREVGEEERGRLWALVSEAFPQYDYYQGKTGRRIPLIVLEPAPD